MSSEQIEKLLHDILVVHKTKIDEEKRYLGLFDDQIPADEDVIDFTLNTPAEPVNAANIPELVPENESFLENFSNSLQLNSYIPSQPHMGIGESEMQLIQNRIQGQKFIPVQLDNEPIPSPRTPNYNKTKLLNDIGPIFQSNANSNNLLTHLGTLRKKFRNHL